MADYIPVPNVAHITHVMSWGGEPITVGTDWRLEGAEWDITSLATIANDAADAWSARMRSKLNTLVSYSKTNARALYSESAPSVDTFAHAGELGTQAGARLPNNVSMVLKFSTDQRGRSFRGRVYIPGMVVESLETSDTWLAAAASAIASNFALYKSDIDDAWTDPEVTQVVVSRFTNNAPRVTGIATEVTDITYNLAVATQRRRIG